MLRGYRLRSIFLYNFSSIGWLTPGSRGVG